MKAVVLKGFGGPDAALPAVRNGDQSAETRELGEVEAARFAPDLCTEKALIDQGLCSLHESRISHTEFYSEPPDRYSMRTSKPCP
jgi:hypothetical protein